MAELIVTRAIAGYAIGDRVTDASEVDKILATGEGRRNTVRVTPAATVSAKASAGATPQVAAIEKGS